MLHFRRAVCKQQHTNTADIFFLVNFGARQFFSILVYSKIIGSVPIITDSTFKMDSTIQRDIKFDEELLNLIKEEESCEQVLEILQGFVIYNSTDESGKTLLHYCAKYNNARLTQNLVDKGCDVNIQDNMGNTPLMIAVIQEHNKVMEILIAAGSDIFKLNNENKSALHVLSELHTIDLPTIKLFFQELQKKCSSKEQIVKELMDAGCHLYQAVAMEDSSIIESMLKQGYPVDSAHPHEKITALHQAVALNDLNSVNVLVKYGANVNALNSRNENPLFHVYKINPEHSHQKIEILKVLLNQGASMTVCRSNGMFQVTYILRTGNYKVIRVLLESGIDFNVRDTQTNKTILHFLAGNRDSKLDRGLKPYVDKFDVNVVDNYGLSPLFIAVLGGNVDMVNFFLKEGGKVNLKHFIHDTTPLYYACSYPKPGLKKQYNQCSMMLLLHNADPQIVAVKDRNEPETIFDVALKSENPERMRPVVAHLAVLEKRGTLITEKIKTTIDSNDSLKIYFDKCRRTIAKPVGGGKVIFDLLIGDERRMARYLDNKDIYETIEGDGYFLHQMKEHSYYDYVLETRYTKALRYKKVRIKASTVIRKFFQNRIHKRNLVIDNIIDYLNYKSLRRLSSLYNQELTYRRKMFRIRKKKL